MIILKFANITLKQYQDEYYKLLKITPRIYFQLLEI